MTNTELETTARRYAELKATEAAAKAEAKPLGKALLGALTERKAAELTVNGVRVARRSRNTRVYDVAVALRRLARKKDLLHQVVRIAAQEWDRAVKAGDIPADVVDEAFVGHEESAPWAEVTVTDEA